MPDAFVYHLNLNPKCPYDSEIMFRWGQIPDGYREVLIKKSMLDALRVLAPGTPSPQPSYHQGYSMPNLEAKDSTRKEAQPDKYESHRPVLVTKENNTSSPRNEETVILNQDDSDVNFEDQFRLE